MVYQQNIINSEIDKLEILKFKGKINVIDNREKLKKIIPEISNSKILGFDTETKPNFKKGFQNRNFISLIQFSTYEKAYLFRINKIGLPKVLISILSNPKILKVGIGIKDDINGLSKIYQKFNGTSENGSFIPKGFFDLQNVVSDFGIEALSLKKLGAIVLDYKISKSMQLSNWESSVLTKKQQQYAAIDALVCLQIYCKLYDNKYRKR